ncbi:cupin domain-containing protein [Actinocorallia populi]|uniref:cysteine dioxygenase n=1 Tax=Actinocorallia populi TaxID=2079200 RepID=UPI001E29B171|nr:cysteine dioxygenase [Actinocorallia populi]
MKTETFPEITMRDQVRETGAPPTVGQLAARLQEAAARPGRWWHLVRFDPAERVRVELEDGLWLITWPPGYRLPAHGHGGAAQIMSVIAGELAEVAVGGDGAVARPLRANRVRIQAGDSMHEVVNPGSAYAVTLHLYV